jgi:hypothetical protein
MEKFARGRRGLPPAVCQAVWVSLKALTTSAS